MNKRVLLIDDVRDCGKGGVVLQPSVICRNGNDGIMALRYLGPWDVLFLDNDMGQDSIEGYKVLDWLESNKVHLPEMIVLVTQNAAAKERMVQTADRLYHNSDWNATEFWNPIRE